ncbi:hypothetical protein N7G274_008573 [Stereocaulon virgatum]|uniref:DUF7029 domain-containing protein n=1 Tax=Stereocaulon virgatum TaxID=373712 RepID=A0ABR4A022_9LECA
MLRCNPADERQPYFISNITEDNATLTTHLAAKPAPWSDVAGTYDLEFGQTHPYPNSQRLKERDLISDGLNAAKLSFDKSVSVSVPVNVGQQGQRTNIYTGNNGGFVLDCTNCFVTGSFEFSGHVSTKDRKLKDLVLTASPKGVQAELELEATISSAANLLNYDKEIFNAPRAWSWNHSP